MQQPGIDERITIHWPDGPHDFVLVDVYVQPVPGFEGWFTLIGYVVDPIGPAFQARRGFYARWVDGRFETVPAKRRPVLPSGRAEPGS